MCWAYLQAKLLDESDADDYPLPEFCSAIHCERGPPVSQSNWFCACSKSLLLIATPDTIPQIMSGDSPYTEYCEPEQYQCELSVSCSFCESSSEDTYDKLSEATKHILRSSDHCSHCSALQECSNLESEQASSCQMEKLCDQCHYYLEELTIKESLNWTRLPDYCSSITGCDIFDEEAPDAPGPEPSGNSPQPSDCESEDAKCELDHMCDHCSTLTSDADKCQQLCSKLNSCQDGNCQVTLECVIFECMVAL